MVALTYSSFSYFVWRPNYLFTRNSGSTLCLHFFLTKTMQEYESQYHEIFKIIPNPDNLKTIIEVGINEGEGTKKLKNHFPNAHLFAIDVHVRHPLYKLSYDEIMRKLEHIATVIIQSSPLPFDWTIPYDLCTIDIGSNPEINLSNLKYWLKSKKENGILAMVIPKGTEEKLQKRIQFIEQIKEMNIKYEEIYYNWIIFK